jgi:hypothetical protein
MESLYAHYPGLIVMTPATVEDAYTMLIEAVAIVAGATYHFCPWNEEIPAPAPLAPALS